MKYYSLLKLNGLIKSPRIKFLGLFFLHKLGKRYLSVHFDPINACNLRCKMCYFTDKDYVKRTKGIFNPEELERFSSVILHRALKLQVGCGTEPTLYKHLDKIFELGHKAKVPHISMTTNANLLEKESLRKWASLGLNEITVSLHGVYKESYENFMGKASFEDFNRSLGYISEVKKEFPSLKLRINYTFNQDNFDELKDFWKIFGKFDIDHLQIRPIVNMGNTEYQNFDLSEIIPKYQNTYDIIVSEAEKNGTVLLAPKKKQLLERKSITSVIEPYTYCYISPKHFWRKDFDWRTETYDQYSKRTGFAKNLFFKIFASKQEIDKLKNNKLNYSVN